MLWCMRTTIRLREEILRRAKRKAAEEGRSLTSVIEEGVRLVLERPDTARKRRAIPVSRASGGVLPGVELNRAADLEARMDEV